ELHVYAPTPQAESTMVTLQAISSLGWELEIADCKNAFCQSDRLHRPKGSIFCEPCQGLNFGPGGLIELIAPVYGLKDAPLLWHRTLAQWLSEDGFSKSLLEPCLWVKRSSQGEIRSLILIEVGDLIVASAPAERQGLKDRLQGRFRFGKWETGEADFAGRHAKQVGQKIFIDQEKYILEQLAPLRLAKGRRSGPEAPLTPEEVKLCRTMVAQIQWLGRESRPDVSAGASIQSAALPSPTVSDAMLCIKIVKHLKGTASQKIVLWPLDPSIMSFAQWLSILWRDLVFGDVSRPDWHLSQFPFSVVLSRDCTLSEGVETLSVVDAKSIFDTLSNSAGSRADRRNSIELAVVRDSMSAV
ncbi:unnamed protein product, partial [Prorocentrum cordatum]